MRGIQRFAIASASSATEARFWGRCPTIWWSYWPGLSSAILERSRGMSSILADSIEADLLFLDDIGSETDRFKTGETVDALCQLFSAREKKWTVVATNIAPKHWQDRFDARVADRLLRHSDLVDLADAQSYAASI